MGKPIFCVGGATVDHKLKAVTPFISSTSNLVSSSTTFGGVARNVAHNLAHWSCDIHLQSISGNDKAGHDLMTFMKNLNVDISTCLTTSHYATAHYYAAINEDGELHIAFADMDIFNNIPFSSFTAHWDQWPNESIVFLDTNLPEIFIQHAILKAREKKIMLCLDPVSVTKSKRVPQFLNGLFLIKPNLMELNALTDSNIQSVDECLRAAKLLLLRGVENVVVSLGKLGYVIANKNKQAHFSVDKINRIVDVSGAGDAFCAGILFGLKENKNIEFSCQLGAAAASLTLQSKESVLTGLSSSQLFSLVN